MILLVKLFLVALVSEVLAWMGTSAISDFIFALYGRIAPSPLFKQQKAMRNELLLKQAELRATSSQDEFAKWAKLRRQLDKQATDLDALGKRIQASNASSQWILTSLLYLITTILPFLYTTRHSKSAIFYLPHGWFGPAGEWLLALPFAPLGSISCAVWMMAVRRALRLSKRAVTELLPSSPPAVDPQATGPKAEL